MWGGSLNISLFKLTAMIHRILAARLNISLLRLAPGDI